MTKFDIHIVSDTVCPWCYVGKKRLEEGIAQYKAAHPDSNDTFSTTWSPFYLDPDAPQQGEDKQARYHRRFGPQRTQLMQKRLADIGHQVGIEFKFGGKTGNTRDSHRLIQLAKTKSPEAQTRLVAQLFEAYFEQEQDITDHGVLLKAAAAAGLDRAEAKDWLDTGLGGPQVDREVLEAQRKLISGVPHFTVNGVHEIEGANEPGVFVEVFERVGEMESQKRVGEQC